MDYNKGFLKELINDINNDIDTIKKHNNKDTEALFIQHLKWLITNGYVTGIGIKIGHSTSVITGGKPLLTKSGLDLITEINSQSTKNKILNFLNDMTRATIPLLIAAVFTSFLAISMVK